MSATKADGMRACALSGVLLRASGRRRLRGPSLYWAREWEGGDFFSWTAREIMRSRLGVDIGAYTYGECFTPDAFPPRTAIGRYVSVAPGVRAFSRNHPYDRLSMHPFFYNRHLGYVGSDTIESGSLEIGADAWLGERAIITPGCRRIGVGAVIGAGAVVTRDVPDFAIAAGNPARVIRMRFGDATREAILASRWWERSIDECAAHMPDMLRPVPGDPSAHPLLAGRAARPAEGAAR